MKNFSVQENRVSVQIDEEILLNSSILALNTKLARYLLDKK